MNHCVDADDGALFWSTYVVLGAGSRAWAGLTHEAILEAVRGPWQLAVPPGLPPVLQELMMSALSKDPKDRWVMVTPACAEEEYTLCVCRQCSSSALRLLWLHCNG